DQLLGRAKTIIAAITNRAKMQLAERKKVGKDASRPRTDADHAKHNPIARRDGSIKTQNGTRHNHWRDHASRGASEELAAVNPNVRLPLHVSAKMQFPERIWKCCKGNLSDMSVSCQ